MSKVACARCSEEILGAVNRCWKCGAELHPHSGPLDVPPIRRNPIRGRLDVGPDDPVMALIVEQVVSGDLAVDSPLAPVASAPTRRGSPFIPRWQPESAEKTKRQSTSGSPPSLVAVWGSFAALGLAVFGGLISLRFPAGGLFLILGAVPFGILGTREGKPQRRVAIGALILACVILAWDLVVLALDLSRRL